MLKNKKLCVLLAGFSLSAMLFSGAGLTDYRTSETDTGNSGSRQNNSQDNYRNWEDWRPDNGSTEKKEETGLTINGEISEDKLYLDALTKDVTGTQTKITSLKYGTYKNVTSLSGSILYTDQKLVKVDFPYGHVYMNSVIDRDDPYRKKGDVIATVYVELDEIEVKKLETKLRRMEERGITGEEYEKTKETLQNLLAAVEKTEIVMEEDGYLLDREFYMRGTEITSYQYVIANPEERLILVSNQGNNFRFGQKVTVSAQVGNQKKTGTGTVITASSSVISADLAGQNALIRLDEDSEELYSGFTINVSVESIHMENVLLLENSAVFMTNGIPMVKIQDENGIHISGFTFGRKGTSEYWVIDGLSEGTKVLTQ